MVAAYRVSKAKYGTSTADMLSGRGSSEAGGRWNSEGRAMVYTSAHLSLAVLEILVHAMPAEKIDSYVFLRLDIPDELILTLGADDLPDGWDQMSVDSPASQSFGDTWFEERMSAVLELPSAAMPLESNYLINPAHPDFTAIEIGEIEPLFMDERFLQRG